MSLTHTLRPKVLNMTTHFVLILRKSNGNKLVAFKNVNMIESTKVKTILPIFHDNRLHTAKTKKLKKKN